MAFEKTKEFYAVVDDAMANLEHAGVKGMRKGFHIMAKDPEYLAWLAKNGLSTSGSVVSSTVENAKRLNSQSTPVQEKEGTDEYGKYKLDSNGEKEYDIGDGLKYFYTDGYYVPKNDPDAPVKQWDPVIGEYVDADPPKEELYPDIGDEPKREKKPNLKKIAEEGLDIKGKPSSSKPTVSGSKVTTWDDVDASPKTITWDDVKSGAREVGRRVKKGVQKAASSVKSLFERIRSKLKHGMPLDDDEYDFLIHCGIDSEEAMEDFIAHVDDSEYLEHHGIDGQKWGVRNGPPYPLRNNPKTVVYQGEKYVNDVKSHSAESFAKGVVLGSQLMSVAADYYDAKAAAAKIPTSALDDEIYVEEYRKDDDGNIVYREGKGGKMVPEKVTKAYSMSELAEKYRSGEKISMEQAKGMAQYFKDQDYVRGNIKTNEQREFNNTANLLREIVQTSALGVSMIKLFS